MATTSAHSMIRNTVLLSVIVLSAAINTRGQEVSRPLPQVQWHVHKCDNVIGNFFSPSSFRRSILKLPDGGSVISAQFDDNMGGVVRMNEDGKPLWQMRVQGITAGIGRLGENFVVFYTDEGSHIKAGTVVFSATLVDEALSSNVHAALLNGKTGKVIEDKLIYDNQKKVYIDTRSLSRPDDSFSSLLIRVSDYDKGTYNLAKEVKERLVSKKLLLVTIDEQLNPKITALNSSGKEGFFIGAEPGPDDDLFIATLIDDQLTVERFNRSGSKLATLSAPLKIRTIWNTIEPVTAVDPANPEDLFIGVRYSKPNKDIMNEVFEFNMATKKVSGSGEQELNKEYRKSLEFTVINGIQKGDKDAVASLRIMNIILTKDKISVIKKMEFMGPSGGNASRFRSDAVVIEIYDRNWKSLKTIVLDRKFETFIPVARSVGAHAVGDKLYVIVPAIKSAARPVTLFAAINLTDLKVDTYKVLSDYTNGTLVEGDAGIWSSDAVLIEHLVEVDGFFKVKKDNYRSIWQKIKL